MDTVTLTFVHQRETKNMQRYDEVVNHKLNVDSEGKARPVVGPLYVSHAVAGNGEKTELQLEVTLKAVSPAVAVAE
jgi:hypothetical protein